MKRCTLGTGFWATSFSESVLTPRRNIIHADDRCITQSVYTVHKLETPVSPPQLGLLSTVNIDKALAEFWEERGYDNTTIGVVALAERVEIRSNSKEVMVYGISVVVGFVVGLIGAVTILWWRSRRSQKTTNRGRPRVSSRRY